MLEIKVARTPDEIRPLLQDSLAEALKKRMREAEAKGLFFLDLEIDLKQKETAVRNWMGKVNLCGLEVFVALADLFGPKFVQEVIGDLLGIHCSSKPLEPTDIRAVADLLAKLVHAEADERLDNVTKIERGVGT